MTNKVKIVSIAFCAAVVLGCLICYSGSVSQMYYEICTPEACSLISAYEAKTLDTVPEAFYDAGTDHFGGYGEESDRIIVEITYELYNPVNETVYFPGDLCYYYGENNEWLWVYEAGEGYSAISDYENCKILPPGESMFFKEYVLVPEDMKEFRACRGWGAKGSREEVTIRL